jgi:hypothetical protein
MPSCNFLDFFLVIIEFSLATTITSTSIVSATLTYSSQSAITTITISSCTGICANVIATWTVTWLDVANLTSVSRFSSLTTTIIVAVTNQYLIIVYIVIITAKSSLGNL